MSDTNPCGLRVRRLLAATRDEVYAAWTDPEQLVAWMSGTDLDLVHARLEARAGGALELDWRAPSSDKVWRIRGRVLDARRPERLRFTWVSAETGGQETIVTVELHEADGLTELVLSHEGFPTGKRAQEHHEGWAGLVEQLGRHVAGAPTRFSLEQATEILGRTPAVLDALLRGLSGAWLCADEGKDTWNPAIVVGHLIHGERTDWIPRARMILETGDSVAFPPFDRFAQLHQCTSIGDSLDTFARERADGLAALAAMRLSEKDLERRGRHPELGSVTLGQLLATWVAHDLTHIYQIVRVMAKRYAMHVGPWRAYLRILSEAQA